MLDIVGDLLTEGEARWWLLGAAAVVGVAKGGRSLAKSAIKGYLGARDGLTRLSQGTAAGLQRLQRSVASPDRGMAAPAGEGTTPAESGGSAPA
jgi:hypothetical protein